MDAGQIEKRAWIFSILKLSYIWNFQEEMSSGYLVTLGQSKAGLEVFIAWNHSRDYQ